MILIYFYNIVSEFYENIYFFLIGDPTLRRKIRINGRIEHYTQRKTDFVFKTVFPRDTGIPFKNGFIFIKKLTHQTGSHIKRGGHVIHDYCYLGKGRMMMTRYLNVLLLTYLRSVFIFIKQYSDSMCFASIVSLKLRIIPYLCEKDVRTPTSFWSS